MMILNFKEWFLLEDITNDDIAGGIDNLKITHPEIYNAVMGLEDQDILLNIFELIRQEAKSGGTVESGWLKYGNPVFIYKLQREKTFGSGLGKGSKPNQIPENIMRSLEAGFKNGGIVGSDIIRFFNLSSDPNKLGSGGYVAKSSRFAGNAYPFYLDVIANKPTGRIRYTLGFPIQTLLNKVSVS